MNPGRTICRRGRRRGAAQRDPWRWLARRAVEARAGVRGRANSSGEIAADLVQCGFQALDAHHRRASRGARSGRAFGSGRPGLGSISRGRARWCWPGWRPQKPLALAGSTYQLRRGCSPEGTSTKIASGGVPASGATRQPREFRPPWSPGILELRALFGSGQTARGDVSPILSATRPHRAAKSV